MLVTLNEIMQIAEAQKCAVGAFNGVNMTCAKAIISAAEELNQPVILMHAQVHEQMGLCKIDEIGHVLLFLADKARVPVCVHLDHGEDLDYVKKALDLGFTSVMYDGSNLSEEMNIANTRIAVLLAKRTGASVEAEIGSMGARESGAGGSDESIYTDPEDAAAFVEKTGINALACAFGTAHGIYLKQPKLDFDRLAAIKKRVDVPLVMHGGSGVSHEDYRKVISLGVRKINYYTYMSKAGGTAAANMAVKALVKAHVDAKEGGKPVTNTKAMTFFHDIEVAAQEGMKLDVMEAIKVFANL
ncbi:MAG: class II fructose-bisphosphate aldolase [Clostridia bacterium]|nr:class II fructose-bisphosphate aldolase [Clostridia bacterium]